MIGVIASARWRDGWEAHPDGSSTYAYVDSPTFGSQTAGAAGLDITIPTLLSVNGAQRGVVLTDNDTTPGNFFAVSNFRQTDFGDSNNHLGLQFWKSSDNSWQRAVVSASTAANTRYRLLINGDGKIYVDGADAGSLLKQRSAIGAWAGEMFNGGLRTGSPVTWGIAASRRPNGTVGDYHEMIIGNVCIYSSALTSGEALLDARQDDRWRHSALRAKLVEGWDLEKGGKARVNSSNDLTIVGGMSFDRRT